MSTQNTHVPKFGNWDGSVPYTQYFETARKGRTGGKVRMNPNDPLENPVAFQSEVAPVHGPYSEATNLHNNRHNDQTTSGNYQRRKSRHSTSEGLSGGSHAVVSNSAGRLRITNSQDQNSVKVRKGSPLPKFGEWDEGDPSSADGFTGIFNMVTEDKQQTGSAKVSSVSSDKACSNGHQLTTPVNSHGWWCFGWCKK